MTFSNLNTFSQCSEIKLFFFLRCDRDGLDFAGHVTWDVSTFVQSVLHIRLYIRLTISLNRLRFVQKTGELDRDGFVRVCVHRAKIFDCEFVHHERARNYFHCIQSLFHSVSIWKNGDPCNLHPNLTAPRAGNS